VFVIHIALGSGKALSYSDQEALVNIGRLPHPTPAELTDEQRAVYEAITEGPRGKGPFRLTDDEGRLQGPFNAMLINPQLGLSLQRLGADIRYRSTLDAREREIAILALAHLRESAFEWYAHERVGRAIGMTRQELDALDVGAEAPASFTDRERVVLATVRALVSERDLDDATYDEAQRHLGRTTLADLITLVGYYDLLALSMRAWRAPLPEGETRRPDPVPAP
jgi:4-carboxymuconolactone decarboxylase